MSALRSLYLSLPGWTRALSGRILRSVIPLNQRYRGLSFRFEETDAVLRSMVFLGIFERQEISRFIAAIKPGDILVDVGANIGLYSVCAAAAGAEVHAFEPAADMRALLAQNATRNGVPLTIHPHAVGVRSGSGTLRRANDLNGGHIQVVEDVSPQPNSISIVALDDVLGDLPHVDAVKMDIEGHEVAALRGARDLLSRHLPRLLIEVFPRLLAEHGATVNDLESELRRHGYVLFTAHGNEIASPISVAQDGYINVVALHPRRDQPEVYFGAAP